MVRAAFMPARLVSRCTGSVQSRRRRQNGGLSLPSLLQMSRVQLSFAATCPARGDEAILDAFGLP
jgi:hypothetical protein